MKQTYNEIKRNRDEKGHILTWSVKLNCSDYWIEYNSFKEARLMAMIL